MAAIPQMRWSRENGPCTTPGAESCWSVHYCIQSGYGTKEPPRRPGCHGGKRFGKFFPLIDEKQSTFTGGANSGPNHHGLLILAMLDDIRRAGSLGEPVSSCRSDDFMMYDDGNIVFHLWTKFAPSSEVWRDEGVVDIFPVVHTCQSLEVEALAWLELKLLFGYSVDRFARDAGFTGNFLHRHCRILLDAFFEELVVPNGVNCALSAASRTVIGVAKLLKPFHGPPDIWRCDAKPSCNVAVGHSLLM